MEIEESRIIFREEISAEAKPLIIVGIPAFNEERNIARVILEAQRHADLVIVCDDGSTDLTGEIADRLGADVIRHEQNLGYGMAIQSLFKRARELGADILVTLDGDGQHESREVPNIVRPIVEGLADIVIGSRFADQASLGAMPRYRRAGVKLITKLVNGSAKNRVKDAQSGFRAYNREALTDLATFEAGMGVSVEILLEARRLGLKIREVACSCKYGTGRTSSHNAVKHGWGVVMSLVKLVVEEKPLTMLGIPGIVCLAIGTLFGSWLLQIYASAHHIVTNIALAATGFLMIGFFALSTSITLYAIRRSVDKLHNNGIH
ncbi:MAG TPA: glycosyltransferase family 2 protein [Candidatus Bathyarchaeia archaeon]|nr:glycosyltransferase family 2 protein [Candidatus Bathyarchaeia archaeon]